MDAAAQTQESLKVQEKSYWIQGPVFDLTLLAFPWVPLCALFVFAGRDPMRASQWLEWGIYFAYSLDFVHRQYTYYIVYGDNDIFSKRKLSFIIAPILVIGFVLLYNSGRLSSTVTVFIGSAMLLWEIWHVVMQRYGLLRIYGAKARGGAESRRTAWGDKAMIWGVIIAATPITYFYHRSAAASTAEGSEMLVLLEPIIRLSPQAFYIVFGAIGVIAVAWWFLNERQLELEPSTAVPRWTFLFATVLMISVIFLVSPLAGFLCVKLSHGVEYIAFVHVYEYRKFKRPDAPRGLVRPLMLYPLIGLVVVGAHFYVWKYVLEPRSGLDWLVVYSSTTGILHFLYDGWIWKVRKPEVRRPIMAT